MGARVWKFAALVSFRRNTFRLDSFTFWIKFARFHFSSRLVLCNTRCPETFLRPKNPSIAILRAMDEIFFFCNLLTLQHIDSKAWISRFTAIAQPRGSNFQQSRFIFRQALRVALIAILPCACVTEVQKHTSSLPSTRKVRIYRREFTSRHVSGRTDGCTLGWMLWTFQFACNSAPLREREREKESAGVKSWIRVIQSLKQVIFDLPSPDIRVCCWSSHHTGELCNPPTALTLTLRPLVPVVWPREYREGLDTLQDFVK